MGDREQGPRRGEAWDALPQPQRWSARSERQAGPQPQSEGKESMCHHWITTDVIENRRASASWPSLAPCGHRSVRELSVASRQERARRTSGDANATLLASIACSAISSQPASVCGNEERAVKPTIPTDCEGVELRRVAHHRPQSPSARADGAFGRYVLPELDVLARVAWSLTRDSSDAEDLVQETLLRAFRSISYFDGAHPRAWLLTIMRNAQLNVRRRQIPLVLRDSTAVDRLAADTEASWDSRPDHAVFHGVFDEAINDCLNSLSTHHRQVVELVDINALTYAEAAELLGIPTGTVMSRLHRARNKMRDHLTAAGLAPKPGSAGTTGSKAKSAGGLP